MTAEQRSLMAKIGIAVIATGVVMVVTVFILSIVSPRNDTNRAAVDTPAIQVSAPAPVIGTTQSIDSITEKDASSEATINAAYEKDDQTEFQSVNKTAGNVGSVYDESNL